MDDPEGGQSAAEELVVEVSAAAAGALAGYTLAGEVGATVGSAAGPILVRQARERIAEWRERRLDEVVALAEAASGLSTEDLRAAAVATPARLQLTAAVLDAVVRAVSEEKVRVLGQLFASGCLHDDDAILSSDALLVAAVADLEKPHIRVLDEMYPRLTRGYEDASTPWRYAWRYSVRDLSTTSRYDDCRGFPEYASTMNSIVSTLARHGLIELAQKDWSEAIQKGQWSPRGGTHSGYVSDDPPESQWHITRFGCLLRDQLAVGGESPGGTA